MFKWLRKTENTPDVIVVFGGWAIGPTCFAHLTGAEDVLFVDDFTNLAAELPDLQCYTTRSLVAWSFGVAAYSHSRMGQRQTFDRHIAINGSLTPINTLTGIPPRVFRKTLENLSEQAFQEFLTVSFDAPRPWQPFNTAARRDELLAIQHRGDAPVCDWDRIWISDRDRIFPPQNLERAWINTPKHIHRINAPHVPFAAWTSWKDLWA